MDMMFNFLDNNFFLITLTVFVLVTGYVFSWITYLHLSDWFYDFKKDFASERERKNKIRKIKKTSRARSSLELECDAWDNFNKKYLGGIN